MSKTKTKPVPQPGQAAPASDEGEPQTMFLQPHEGGSYVRNADGSLTRVVAPTKVGDGRIQQPAKE